MYRLLACITLLALPPLSSSGQVLPDPALTFSQSKQRLLADLERLPRYTCVQTITRRYYLPPFHWTSPSCKEVIAEHEKRTHELTLRGWDRLRLDIAVAESGEIYSWAGAPRFEEGTLVEVAGEGPLGSGDFGSFVSGILRVGTIKLQGEKFIEGRRLLEYSYIVPEKVSRYVIDTTRKEQFITGYSGTFLLDRDDPDLFRLTVRTDELPQQSRRCQAISEVEYQRIPIHGNQVLIPRETHLRVIGRSGEEVLNTTSYADCHEYGSKSVLHFDAVDTDSGGSTPTPPPPTPIPAGVHFDWRVVTPIDSETAAAGDPVEAVLRSPIRDKKGTVIAAAGTHIHGRLVLFAEHSGREYFQIALKFESIDVNGATIPFNAKLQGEGIVPFEFRHAPQTGALTGAAWFFFNTNHLKLDHLDSTGVTTSPPHKEEKGNHAKAAR